MNNNKEKEQCAIHDISDCSCGYDSDDWCKKCGSSAYYEDCWSCGGEGGRGYDDDLQFEDPLWYSPGDFVKCDICEGKGTFKRCLNEECGGE